MAKKIRLKMSLCVHCIQYDHYVILRFQVPTNNNFKLNKITKILIIYFNMLFRYKFEP